MSENLMLPRGKFGPFLKLKRLLRQFIISVRQLIESRPICDNMAHLRRLWRIGGNYGAFVAIMAHLRQL